MRKTFLYRLNPTAAQETALQHTLDECRWLYNHLLEERKTAWEERKEALSLFGQQAMFGLLKVTRPSLVDVHSQVLQHVAVRIDLAFKAFFRRVRAGEDAPGFPRFRGFHRYDSFCYPQSGYSMQGDAVRLSKIGDIPAVIHRPLEGTVKTCCVKRSSTGKWFVAFACEREDAPAAAVPEEAVGIDVGLASFATLSTGETIANPRFFRRDEQDLARTQRRLSKAAQGSAARQKRRKIVARVHERIANRRKNFAHQHSRKLVNRFTIICVEDLSLNRMVHNHCLAQSIADAAWGQCTDYLTYKAACAGGQVVRVNPAYTRQTCSGCGHRHALPLSDRLYRCACCGLVIDRDHNAALTILGLGLQAIGATP